MELLGPRVNAQYQSTLLTLIVGVSLSCDLQMTKHCCQLSKIEQDTLAALKLFDVLIRHYHFCRGRFKTLPAMYGLRNMLIFLVLYQFVELSETDSKLG